MIFIFNKVLNAASLKLHTYFLFQGRNPQFQYSNSLKCLILVRNYIDISYKTYPITINYKYRQPDREHLFLVVVEFKLGPLSFDK